MSPRTFAERTIGALLCFFGGHRFPPFRADHVRCLTCGRWF